MEDSNGNVQVEVEARLGKVGKKFQAGVHPEEFDMVLQNLLHQNDLESFSETTTDYMVCFLFY